MSNFNDLRLNRYWGKRNGWKKKREKKYNNEVINELQKHEYRLSNIHGLYSVRDGIGNENRMYVITVKLCPSVHDWLLFSHKCNGYFVCVDSNETNDSSVWMIHWSIFYQLLIDVKKSETLEISHRRRSTYLRQVTVIIRGDTWKRKIWNSYEEIVDENRVKV